MTAMGRLFTKMFAAGQKMRLSQLSEVPPDARSIIFLGDDLIQLGNWNEWFPGQPIRNLGVEGATVKTARGVLALVATPQAIVISAGLNDVAGMGASTDPVKIARCILELVVEARSRFAECDIAVLALPPRSRGQAHRTQSVNAEVQRELPDDIVFVDTWASLATPDGRLRRPYRALRWSGPVFQEVARLLSTFIPESEGTR